MSSTPNIETVGPDAAPAARADERFARAYEQIALADDGWTIVAVNPAWTKTAALYGYDQLIPGTNYLAFCYYNSMNAKVPPLRHQGNSRRLWG